MQPGKLDRLSKEIFALAVSFTNNCTCWINSHSAAVKRLGLDNEAVAKMIAVVEVIDGANNPSNASQVTPDVVTDTD